MAARLLGKAPPEAPAEGRSPDAGPSLSLPDLAGKFVLIGVTAAGVGDNHETPLLTRYGAMPGLLVHAAAVNAILTGRFVRPVGTGSSWCGGSGRSAGHGRDVRGPAWLDCCVLSYGT